MCLYSYVPTRAAQQFVDDIFDFTVSDTELYRIIEQSKDAYKKRIKQFIDNAHTLVFTEDNLDVSLRIGGNKTIVYHFVSRLISIMNTSDTPNLHFGGTPWFTRDELDVSVFAASSVSSAADLRRLCAEDMVTACEDRGRAAHGYLVLGQGDEQPKHRRTAARRQESDSNK